MINNSLFYELFGERYREIIPDFEDFFLALEKPFPIGLRLNQLKTSIEEMDNRFKLQNNFNTPIKGLQYMEVSEDINWGGALEHHLGFYYIQALSSLLPVLALNLTVNSKVLDMCAAPGGKTTHISEVLKRSGVVVANEPHLGRRRILKASLNRLGSTNVLVCGENGQDLKFPAKSFDYILLDGPCSSEGTLRTCNIKPSKKRDRSYLSYNKPFREELHLIQTELLNKAHQLLKPGGILVYSTCTYDPLENENQVTEFLRRFDDIDLVDLGIDSNWNRYLSDGISQYQNLVFDKNISLTKRIYPHKLNSIGFYVSKFIKRI